MGSYACVKVNKIRLQVMNKRLILRWQTLLYKMIAEH